MPALSLVVCLHGQRNLLERLLAEADGCFDDLVVVHDGPDITNVRSLVEAAGGRFFERPREHQQEPHWPFAWQQAAHDWILRLDADEFPSDAMKRWLQGFRKKIESEDSVSGYTCIWPLWNGQRTISRKLPAQRNFLFHRKRVRFFGMVEQVPVPDGHYEPLDLILHHRPQRKSYGVHNLIIRRQAYIWRNCIAHSLLGKPTDLTCWRWNTDIWPMHWEEIRQRPIRTFFSRLVFGTLRTLRDQWRIEGRLLPAAAISGPIHHAMICVAYWKARRSRQIAIARQSSDNSK